MVLLKILINGKICLLMLRFLSHVCNSRCLKKTADGTMKCRKLNYLDFSKDNTKHKYARFADDLPDDTLKRLV